MPDDDAAAAAAAAAAENKTWHSSLPEDLRADPSLVDFKDESEMVSMPVNVARSYINTKKLVGRDKIPMPTTDEEFMATYDRLGRPKEATGYKLEVPESVTNEQIRESLTKQSDWFKGVAHEIGLSDAQATKLFSKYSDLTQGQVGELQRTAEAAYHDAEINLRTEYGNAFEGKMVLMNRALDALDNGTGLKALVKDSGLARHPAVIKTFVKVGEMMSEDLGLDKTTGELADTPENLQEQKMELMRSAAYTNASDPAHDLTVQKVARLIEKISGSTVVPTSDRSSFIS